MCRYTRYTTLLGRSIEVTQDPQPSNVWIGIILIIPGPTFSVKQIDRFSNRERASNYFYSGLTILITKGIVLLFSFAIFCKWMFSKRYKKYEGLNRKLETCSFLSRPQ